jgi:NAD(P)-dependent dehydrogenase (short-subunit alcohol dehydrogenase family)
MRLAISGVSRGIGEGIARAALSSGDSVVGIGRTPPRWADQQSGFTFIHCDMSDHARLADACSALADPIDALICNAATFSNGAWTADSFSGEALREAFAVNTIAPLVMAKSLKKNLETGSRRLIIMMSTGNASLEGNTSGTMLGYRLSKSALNQAVRSLAAEWANEGFSVVALNPGWVRTDMGGPGGTISVEEASKQIMNFISYVSATKELSGCFVNTDGSPLPW